MRSIRLAYVAKDYILYLINIELSMISRIIYDFDFTLLLLLLIKEMLIYFIKKKN